MGIRDRLFGSVPQPVQETKEDFFVSSFNGGDRHLEFLAEAIRRSKNEKGVKQTESVLQKRKRIDSDKLAMIYTMDEIVFRCTNIYAVQAVAPWFQLIGKTEQTVRIEQFIRKRRIRQKLKTVVIDLCVDGNAFWEKIRNSEGKMVDVQRILPSQIDFKRTSTGAVEEDESGNPVGYIFKTASGTEKPLPTKDVIHFKLLPMGNERGLGYVEPLYRLVLLKLNIRDGYAQAGYRAGHPLYIVYIGDKPDKSNDYAGHKVTPEMGSKIENEFQHIETRHMFTMPFFTKVEAVGTTDAKPQAVILEYNDMRIANGFGIPIDIALGGTKGAKAALDVSIETDFDRNIRELQNNLGDTLENELFTELLGITDNIPQTHWNQITQSDLNRKAKRISTYVQFGVLKPEDVRDVVLKEEGLRPTDDELLQKQKGMELLADTFRRMSSQEAIVFLLNLKDAFPGQLIEKIIDDLIKQIELKTTGVEIPTSSDGMESSRNEEVG